MLRARYCTDLAETTLERKIRNLIKMLGKLADLRECTDVLEVSAYFWRPGRWQKKSTQLKCAQMKRYRPQAMPPVTYVIVHAHRGHQMAAVLFLAWCQRFWTC
jgi:hypothetical protein